MYYRRTPKLYMFSKSLKYNVDKLQTHNTWEPSRSTLELSKVMKSSHAEVFLKLHQTKLSIFKTVSCITKRSCLYSKWNWSCSRELSAKHHLKGKSAEQDRQTVPMEMAGTCLSHATQIAPCQQCAGYTWWQTNHGWSKDAWHRNVKKAL